MRPALALLVLAAVLCGAAVASLPLAPLLMAGGAVAALAALAVAEESQ